MAGASPAESAAKYAKNLAASGESYKGAINRVSVNPAQQAIAAIPLMRANFNEAIDSGKVARGLAGVSLPSWKQSCIEKGAASLVASARLAAEKWQRKESEIKPTRDGILSGLPPRGTIEQNFERSRQFGMAMHEAAQRG